MGHALAGWEPEVASVPLTVTNSGRFLGAVSDGAVKSDELPQICLFSLRSACNKVLNLGNRIHYRNMPVGGQNASEKLKYEVFLF